MATRSIEDAWKRFKNQADPRARDVIIDNYTYLVKITAGRIIRILPPQLDREDLYSAGAVGLISAVDQFDPDRRVKFETYAIALIRVAILDSLRSEDWVPRSVRYHAKNLEKALVELEIRLGAPPNEIQIAEYLGISEEELTKILIDIGRAGTIGLEDSVNDKYSLDNAHISDFVVDDQMLPESHLELREQIRHLGEAIDRLPERERLIIALYYYEGLTYREIGEVLQVTNSRIYQLHAQAILRVKGYTARDKDLFR